MAPPKRHIANRVFTILLRHLPAIVLLVVAYCTYTRSSLAAGLLNDQDLLLQVALGTVLFYGNVYGVFPWVGRRFGWQPKAVWITLLAEWAVIVAVVLLISLISGALEIRIRSLQGLAFQVANVFAVLLPLVLCLCYSVHHYRMYRMKADRQQVLSDAAELEKRLDALQRKGIHVHLPEHFLLNSLGLLRALSMAGSPRLGEAYDLLLDILHYCLMVRSKNAVPVKKELKQTEKLIRIANLRFNGSVQLTVITHGSLKRARIVPMAILTLVENIFAHGDFLNSRSKAELHVDYRYPYLFITTRNRPAGSTGHKGTGFGLSNLQQRLQNSFPDASLLEYSVVDGWFIVSLLVSMDGPRPDLPPLSAIDWSETFT